jgi:hypothetical protein
MRGKDRLGAAARPRSGAASVVRLVSVTTTSRRLTDNGRASATGVEVVVIAEALPLSFVRALLVLDPPHAVRPVTRSTTTTRRAHSEQRTHRLTSPHTSETLRHKSPENIRNVPVMIVLLVLVSTVSWWVTVTFGRSRFVV